MCKILVAKCHGERLLGEQNCRLESDVKVVLTIFLVKEMGLEDIRSSEFGLVIGFCEHDNKCVGSTCSEDSFTN